MGPWQPARFWKKGFVYYLKAVTLIGLRGHGRGGKRRRRERSLVAAALSKMDAGVALLVREVGVALLLCFYSVRRDMCICGLCFAGAFTLSKSVYVCICCLCFAGAFTLSKSDASPERIISGVSLL